jgi:hypothetical protein
MDYGSKTEGSTFDFKHGVQTGYGTHPAVYLMGTEISLREDKFAEG